MFEVPVCTESERAEDMKEVVGWVKELFNAGWETTTSGAPDFGEITLQEHNSFDGWGKLTMYYHGTTVGGLRCMKTSTILPNLAQALCSRQRLAIRGNANAISIATLLSQAKTYVGPVNIQSP